MGAGLLPIAINKGVIFLLLGRERYDKKWSDFGGSTENKEKFYETAIREGQEELNGILGTGDKFKKTIDKNLLISVNNNNNYHSFLFKSNYDKQLPYYFNNNNKFIEEKLKNIINNSHKDHTGLFEKDRIKWFSLNDIEDNYTCFRPHFIPILKKIVNSESDFIYKIEKNSINLTRTRKISKINK